MVLYLLNKRKSPLKAKINLLCQKYRFTFCIFPSTKCQNVFFSPGRLPMATCHVGGLWPGAGQWPPNYPGCKLPKFGSKIREQSLRTFVPGEGGSPVSCRVCASSVVVKWHHQEFRRTKGSIQILLFLKKGG